MNYSVTYVGAIVATVVMVAQFFGVQLADETVTKAVEGVLAVLSIVSIFYGRYRAGGVTALGFRKPTA